MGGSDRTIPINAFLLSWSCAGTFQKVWKQHRVAGVVGILHYYNKKIETLKPRTGASTHLLSFLKSIADKFSIHITGNPICYEPTYQAVAAAPLSQDQLEKWYTKQGFEVRKGGKWISAHMVSGRAWGLTGSWCRPGASVERDHPPVPAGRTARRYASL